MDFYLTEIEHNERIHFPMNPETVSLSTGANMQSYEIMQLGEIRIPAGNRLEQISWEGKLPGKGRSEMSFVKSWRDPSEIYALLKKYKETGVKLRLLITETPINIDVYIEELKLTFGSAMGDYDYQISLVEAKDLKIYTVDEINVNNNKRNTGTKPRPEPPPQKTYVVKPGDSLWKIAQKTLGNGSRYMEIFNANKPPLGSNPSLIYPGQVLTIPV